MISFGKPIQPRRSNRNNLHLALNRHSRMEENGSSLSNDECLISHELLKWVGKLMGIDPTIGPITPRRLLETGKNSIRKRHLRQSDAGNKLN